ncbi:hypothetical protein MLD38_013843 [Melastoma candidum]|uniref:Uncharacterized protein n=1 Tax=Melastoma candidum TaxID=119954 RepID=A0ACB9RAU6_9MYRT|nr:hypothetical protein MLD38_013843 [Melastoma candidum]
METKTVLLLLLLVPITIHQGRSERDALKTSTENRDLEAPSESVRGDGPLHSHMDHMDPSTMIFFTVDDLKVGKTMPVYFPKRDTSSSPRLLPREVAKSFPFSSDRLPDLLRLLSLSPSSAQATAMRETHRHCETKPVKGETKLCLNSLGDMLDFVRTTLGGKYSNLRAISTTHLTASSVRFQNYTIVRQPWPVPAQRMVACHTVPYPYAVFYCHSQMTENRVYEVALEGENKDRVKAVAVCHMDTSQWSRDHASFRVLGIEPGSKPVCHFFPADNLVWVPTEKPIEGSVTAIPDSTI